MRGPIRGAVDPTMCGGADGEPVLLDTAVMVMPWMVGGLCVEQSACGSVQM